MSATNILVLVGAMAAAIVLGTVTTLLVITLWEYVVEKVKWWSWKKGGGI